MKISILAPLSGQVLQIHQIYSPVQTLNFQVKLPILLGIGISLLTKRDVYKRQVSLHLEGDHILVQNCRLLGNQDTVYTGIANNRSAFYLSLIHI